MEARTTATWIAQKLDGEVRGRLTKAAKYFEQELKRVLNVQAPRKRITSKKGEAYYRALTPARRGAPPRRLSGLGRAGLTVKVEDRSVLVVYNAARSRSGFDYMSHHEGINKKGLHQYIAVTWKRIKPELERIAGVKLKNLKTIITPRHTRPQRRSTGIDVSS